MFFMTRLCIYLILLTTVMCRASAIGQTRIDLNMKSSALSDVIWELQKQTGFVFVYNTLDVEHVVVDPISVNQATGYRRGDTRPVPARPGCAEL